MIALAEVQQKRHDTRCHAHATDLDSPDQTVMASEERTVRPTLERCRAIVEALRRLAHLDPGAIANHVARLDHYALAGIEFANVKAIAASYFDLLPVFRTGALPRGTGPVPTFGSDGDA